MNFISCSKRFLGLSYGVLTPFFASWETLSYIYSDIFLTALHWQSSNTLLSFLVCLGAHVSLCFLDIFFHLSATFYFLNLLLAPYLLAPYVCIIHIHSKSSLLLNTNILKKKKNTIFKICIWLKSLSISDRADVKFACSTFELAITNMVALQSNFSPINWCS